MGKGRFDFADIFEIRGEGWFQSYCGRFVLEIGERYCLWARVNSRLHFVKVYETQSEVMQVINEVLEKKRRK